jgi:acyl carrier protein
MQKQEFLAEMENILDVPARSLTGEELLSDFDAWDSLAMLAFSVLASEMQHREISGRVIRGARTVNDLYGLISDATGVAV